MHPWFVELFLKPDEVLEADEQQRSAFPVHPQHGQGWRAWPLAASRGTASTIMLVTAACRDNLG
jgi:hypothetical protein